MSLFKHKGFLLTYVKATNVVRARGYFIRCLLRFERGMKRAMYVGGAATRCQTGGA